MPTWTNDETGEVMEFDNPADMRTQLEAALKEKRELEKWKAKAEPILTAKEQADREQAVTTVFTESGLSERAAQVFRRLNPDAAPTEEAVTAFIEEMPEFAPQPLETNVTSSATVAVTGNPVVRPSRPITEGEPGTGLARITRKELDELYKTNPEAARVAIAERRVEWNNPSAAEAILGRAQ